VPAKLWTTARKTGIAVLGIAATLATEGLLPAPWDRWGPVAVAVAVALGVHVTPDRSRRDDPRDYPTRPPYP
jgi:hypothetical protein